MIANIADGYWVDLSLVTVFFINSENDATFMLSGCREHFRLRDSGLVRSFEKSLREYFMSSIKRRV